MPCYSSMSACLRHTLLALLLACTASPRLAMAASPLPEGVLDQSYVLPDGGRVLQLSAEIDAPVAQAWAAFATEQGFTAWAVALAKIDLRVGGSIESSYDAKVPLGSGKTIRNQLDAVVPERLLVMHNVQAPPGVPFDVGIFQSTQTALWFEPLGAQRARLTLVNGPFMPGPAYDGVLGFFRAGNAYTLDALRKHLKPTAPAGAR